MVPSPSQYLLQDTECCHHMNNHREANSWIRLNRSFILLTSKYLFDAVLVVCDSSQEYAVITRAFITRCELVTWSYARKVVTVAVFCFATSSCFHPLANWSLGDTREWAIIFWENPPPNPMTICASINVFIIMIQCADIELPWECFAVAITFHRHQIRWAGK